MRGYLLAILAVFTFCAWASPMRYGELQQELKEYVESKDATIGVAVVIDGVDRVEVNGDREFPMLSVYKFPIALALAEHYRQNKLPFDFPIAILPEDLHTDTYSPMTEKILSSSRVQTDTLMMPTGELLSYMLQLSDNNASDIVLQGLGGAQYVEDYLGRIGVVDVHVCNSEAEMHRAPSLCYANSATPEGMASLMDIFGREFNDSLSIEIKHLMSTCETGAGRLPKPLACTDAVVCHKTGTGFTLPDGRLMAVNDAGYVSLPDGRAYSIAVFIENSGYDMAQTEAIIAEISGMVYGAVSSR